MKSARTQTGGWIEASGPDAHVVIKHDLPIPQITNDNDVLIKLEYSGVW